MLAQPQLSGKPILVLANKQDLSCAAAPHEVASALQLHLALANQFNILPCVATAPVTPCQGALDLLPGGFFWRLVCCCPLGATGTGHHWGLWYALHPAGQPGPCLRMPWWPTTTTAAAAGASDAQLREGLHWLVDAVHRDFEALAPRVRQEAAEAQAQEVVRRKEREARAKRAREERERLEQEEQQRQEPAQLPQADAGIAAAAVCPGSAAGAHVCSSSGASRPCHPIEAAAVGPCQIPHPLSGCTVAGFTDLAQCTAADDDPAPWGAAHGLPGAAPRPITPQHDEAAAASSACAEGSQASPATAFAAAGAADGLERGALLSSHPGQAAAAATPPAGVADSSRLRTSRSFLQRLPSNKVQPLM